MRRSRKLIIAAVLAAVLLCGSLGGIALANDGDDGAATKVEALWDRVGELYQQKTGDTLDQEALKEALAEAGEEMRMEAMKDRLQYLVDEGKITQEQADEYLNWQEARPDLPAGFGFRGPGGRMPMHGCFGPQPPE